MSGVRGENAVLELEGELDREWSRSGVSGVSDMQAQPAEAIRGDESEWGAKWDAEWGTGWGTGWGAEWGTEVSTVQKEVSEPETGIEYESKVEW